MRQRIQNGFTLVELLVVIGIIALLISILLPVLSKAKEQANAIRCSSNQRQIVLAMMMYANDNKGILPIPYGVQPPAVWQHGSATAIWMDADNTTGFRYRWGDGEGTLWPYIGTKDVGARAALFACPTDFDPRAINALGNSAPRNFSYVFNSDLYKVCGGEVNLVPSYMQSVGVRLQRITGAEHKILIFESSVSIFSGARVFLYIPNRFNLLTGRHSGRCFVGMADGHVELFDPAEVFNPRPGTIVTIGSSSVTPQYAFYFLLPH